MAQPMTRMTGLKASAVVSAALILSGLTTTVEATPFGVDVFAQGNSNFAQPGCGAQQSYSTPDGGTTGPDSTGALGCTNSQSGPTGTGLTSAAVNASSSASNGTPASGSAAADLADASLHASAATPTYPGAGAPAQGVGNAQWWDTLTFTVQGANATTVTEIPFTFSVEGSAAAGSVGDQLSASAAVQVVDSNSASFECQGAVFPIGCEGGAGRAEWSSDTVTSPSNQEQDTAFVIYDTPSVDTLTDFTVGGMLVITGPQAIDDITAQLNLQADIGTLNYDDTAQFSFTLPLGVTYTSASGVFDTQTSAVPEPDSLPLLATALLGFAVVGAVWASAGGRERRKRPSRPPATSGDRSIADYACDRVRDRGPMRAGVVCVRV